jgi:hypothetical protein
MLPLCILSHLQHTNNGFDHAHPRTGHAGAERDCATVSHGQQQQHRTFIDEDQTCKRSWRRRNVSETSPPAVLGTREGIQEEAISTREENQRSHRHSLHERGVSKSINLYGDQSSRVDSRRALRKAIHPWSRAHIRALATSIESTLPRELRDKIYAAYFLGCDSDEVVFQLKLDQKR